MTHQVRRISTSEKSIISVDTSLGTGRKERKRREEEYVSVSVHPVQMTTAQLDK